MHWPLGNCYPAIPIGQQAGAFGVKRKYDVHTGVDLYCNEAQCVVSIEDGIVQAIEPFTGKSVGSPWWNDTSCVAIAGATGVCLYGEIQPHISLAVGDNVKCGQLLGHVLKVLKIDKGLPMTMLHFELYESWQGCASWMLGDEKPSQLKDPTELLLKLKAENETIHFNK